MLLPPRNARKARRMDLSDMIKAGPRNLLPHDGIVHYYGPILSRAQADRFLERLLSGVEWRNDEVVIFGKAVLTKRMVAWYADRPVTYTYAKVTKVALPWMPELLELKSLVEERSGEVFNSCLLNLYHDGGEGMGWHSDGERDLKKDAAIGSLSLGAERRFAFKHRKGKQPETCTLEHGSLLVMQGTTQTHWLHRLPPMKGVKGPRVNLTFRSIDGG